MMTTTPATPYRSRAWFDTPELYGWLRRAACKLAATPCPALPMWLWLGVCPARPASRRRVRF